MNYYLRPKTLLADIAAKTQKVQIFCCHVPTGQTAVSTTFIGCSYASGYNGEAELTQSDLVLFWQKNFSDILGCYEQPPGDSSFVGGRTAWRDWMSPSAPSWDY